MGNRVGCICGLPLHSDIAVRLLSVEGVVLKRAPSPFGALLYHIFGIPVPDARLMASVVSHARQGTLVFHWVGSDVLAYARGLSSDWRSRRYWASYVLSHVYGSATHFCGAPWLCDELKELGVTAQYLPFPAHVSSMPCGHGIPSEPTFLSYIPEGREDFYGWDIIHEAASTNPQYRWLIVKNSGKRLTAPANVSFIGNVAPNQMHKVYDRSTCLVRLTQHDGLSLSVLEALAAGRYVIWTYPLDGCYRTERNPDSLGSLLHIVANKGTTNEEGRRVFQTHFSTKAVSEQLSHALGKVVRMAR